VPWNARSRLLAAIVTVLTSAVRSFPEPKFIAQTCVTHYERCSDVQFVKQHFLKHPFARPLVAEFVSLDLPPKIQDFFFDGEDSLVERELAAWAGVENQYAEAVHRTLMMALGPWEMSPMTVVHQLSFNANSEQVSATPWSPPQKEEIPRNDSLLFALSGAPRAAGDLQLVAETRG
jgi:hypothetical protein